MVVGLSDLQPELRVRGRLGRLLRAALRELGAEHLGETGPLS